MKRTINILSLAMAFIVMRGFSSTSAYANKEYAHICAQNDKAGYVGMIFAKWHYKGKHERHSVNISSPFTACIDVPRNAKNTEVEVRMLSAGSAIGVDTQWVSLHNDSSSITGCVKNMSKKQHDTYFVFSGSAFSPNCEQKRAFPEWLKKEKKLN